jgi:mono/diheme cytochrome c family protein
MKKKKIIYITLTIILFVMAISYWAVIKSVEEPFEEQGREKATIQAGINIADLSEAKTLYQQNCSNCHGVYMQGAKNWMSEKDNDGMNLPPPLNGTGHTWHHSEDLLFNIIKYGGYYYDEKYEGKMLGFENNLSDDEIYSIISYIYNSWPNEIKSEWSKLN